MGTARDCINSFITCDNASEPDITVFGYSPGLERGLKEWLGLLCELSNDGAEGAPRGEKKSFRILPTKYTLALPCLSLSLTTFLSCSVAKVSGHS